LIDTSTFIVLFAQLFLVYSTNNISNTFSVKSSKYECIMPVGRLFYRWGSDVCLLKVNGEISGFV